MSPHAKRRGNSNRTGSGRGSLEKHQKTQFKDTEREMFWRCDRNSRENRRCTCYSNGG